MSRLQTIRELQKQLSDAYSKPTSNKLTDRNVADLLVQLIQDGDIELYYTVDGLEYVTPRQLWKEIEREVAEQGGRRTIFGFQSILSVDAQHIDRVIRKNAIHFNTATSNFSQFTLGGLNGAQGLEPIFVEKQLFSEELFYLPETNEIMNGAFNTRMVMMLAEQLSLQGIANLQEFASLNSIPYAYLERLVQSAIAHTSMLPNTELDGTNRTLVTDDAKRKFVLLLRAALCACTRPVSVQKLLIQQYDIYSTPSLLNDAIEILQREALGVFEISGREKVVFYPQLFLNARNSWISAALAKDMCISLKDLAKIGLPNPKKTDFSVAVFILPFSVVSTVLIEQLEASIIEAANENNIIEFIAPLVPDGLAKDDVKAILNQNLSKLISEHGRLVADYSFLPTGLTNRCLSLFEQYFSEKIQAERQSENQDSHIISPSMPSASRSSVVPVVDLNFTLEMIRKWCPNLRKHEVALRTMAQILLPQLHSLTASHLVLSSSTASSSEKSSWKKSEWVSEFEPIYLNLIFFLKSAEQLPSVVSPDQRTQLLHYALETLGKEVLKKLREACVMKYLVGIENEEDFQIFPSEIAKPLKLLFELTRGNEKNSSLKRVSKCVGEALQELNCTPPKLDEKTMETILHTHRTSAMKQLETASEPSTRLRLVFSLLHSRISGTMLLTTTKHLSLLQNTISALIQADPPLKNFDGDLTALVSASYAALLNTIRAKQSKDPDARQQAQTEFQIALEPLIENLK
jgi:hypothetical protein